MSRRDLSPELEDRMLDFAAAGRAAWGAGDIETAGIAFQHAWETMPDPKDQWDYAGSIARGMVVFLVETGQGRRALEWMSEIEKLYSDDTVTTDFLRGTAYFTAGDEDLAYECFDRCARDYGKRPFEGEDPRYWKFYRERHDRG